MGMKIRTVRYSFGEGIRSIRRNRVMSIASIMTVTATLFVFGVFLLLIYNVNSIISTVEDKIEIKVFLNNDMTTLKEQGLEASIKEIEGVKSITYISKEQALESFTKQLGEDSDFAKGLEIDNPLPPSFVVKVTDPKLVVSVSSKINGLPGVYQIKDGRDIVNKVMNIVSFVKGTSLVLMIILGIVSTFLISNTIKLTVYARKKEIAIMKYIGATDGFIKWPFIIEGIILGLFGALIATGLLGYGYHLTANAISTGIMAFSLVPASGIILQMLWQFSIVGMIIGGAGSILSLKKFLVV